MPAALVNLPVLSATLLILGTLLEDCLAAFRASVVKPGNYFFLAPSNQCSSFLGLKAGLSLAEVPAT
ncbi:hypothetical protein D3C71_1243300 [compost metagenome]